MGLPRFGSGSWERVVSPAHGAVDERRPKAARGASLASPAAAQPPHARALPPDAREAVAVAAGDEDERQLLRRGAVAAREMLVSTVPNSRPAPRFPPKTSMGWKEQDRHPQTCVGWKSVPYSNTVATQ